jgi:hypothetical protein
MDVPWLLFLSRSAVGGLEATGSVDIDCGTALAFRSLTFGFVARSLG